MPHELPVNEPGEENLTEQQEKQEEQFAALNAVIKARNDAGCNSNECDKCGNADCVIANKNYLKLWPENAFQLIEKEPLMPHFRENKTRIVTEVHEPNLFDLFANDSKKDAA